MSHASPASGQATASHGAHDAHGAHGAHATSMHVDSRKLGVWAFLAQEILFFSGLFVAYALYRTGHPEAFSVGSHLLNPIMGGINTCVLLISSFTAAMAVRYAQIGEQKRVTQMLIITILCALGFMVIKYFEYTAKMEHGTLPGRCFGHPWFADGCIAGGANVQPLPVHGLNTRASMFFALYFMMTGLHGVHVLVGAPLPLVFDQALAFPDLGGGEHAVAVDGGTAGDDLLRHRVDGVVRDVGLRARRRREAGRGRRLRDLPPRRGRLVARRSPRHRPPARDSGVEHTRRCDGRYR